MKRRDPMTADVRLAVLQRDQGCVAPRIGDEGIPCGGRLEVDHVRPYAGSLTVSGPAHCVTLCTSHHRLSWQGYVWATANRPALRAYLESVRGD